MEKDLDKDARLDDLEEERVDSQDEYYWYVVSVVKNSEMALYKSFAELARMPDQNVLEVYIPEETVKKYKDNKEIEHKQPIMNYLFVKCRVGFIQTKELKTKINRKYQVIGTISEAEVQKTKVDNEKITSVQSFELSPGMRVKIVAGEYKELDARGQIKSIESDGSVIITLFLMGGFLPTSIEVRKSDLVPIEDE